MPKKRKTKPAQLARNVDRVCRALAARPYTAVDIVFEKARLTRLAANEALAWMANKGMLKFGIHEVGLVPTLRDRFQKGQLPKSLRKKLAQTPVLRPSFATSSGALEGSTPSASRLSTEQIRETIQRNLREFVNTSNTAWKALSGPDRQRYAADSRVIRRDLDTLSDRLSHYLEKAMISQQQAVQAEQVVRALTALVNEAELAELEEAFRPFRWPTTEVNELARRLSSSFEAGEGLLGIYEYRVGYTGDHVLDRRAVLKEILEDLSDRPKEIYPGCGPAKSCMRLRVVAYAIAGCVRRARRRVNADMSKAISDWVDDLAWLKETYYDGRCDGSAASARFTWPVV